MKTVCFIRHAKSDWHDYRLSDHDRPLDDRGTADAPFMADLLQRTGISVDGLLSSTAVRAYTTALVFAEVFGIPEAEILKTKDLYHSDIYEMRIQLQALPASWDTVLLFAHNPGLTEMANSLPNSPLLDNLPTCGILETYADIGSWREWSHEKANLNRSFFPKNYQ